MNREEAHNYNVMKNLARKAAAEASTGECDDVLDFAMLTPPTRPGPCKAEIAPEVNPVEKRLDEEREAARFRVLHAIGVEVKHGSGKVKV